MSTETDNFDSTLSPEDVLDSFEALAAEKGWKLQERSDSEAAAKKTPNLRTFGDQIELSAESLADGRTRVHVVVHSRQIVDWGSNEDVTAAIHARLAGTRA